MPNIFLETIVDHVGSQVGLAKQLKVSPAFVHQMLSGTRPVPPNLCPRLEKLSGGSVSRKDLRPLDWQEIWPELEVSDPPSIEASR